MQESKNTRFVKIHPNSSCLFSGAEISFLILLLDQEFLRDMGYNSTWSRSYFQKHTGVSNVTFTKCADKLEGIGILFSSQNRTGEKKKYRLNYEAYEKTMLLLDTTNNREVLRDFCERHFSKANSIFDVTEDQLLQLRRTKKQETTIKNDMVNTQTIEENDMVSKTIEKDTKTISEMIMVPETIYKNDMVFNNNAITIAKNDTVLAEDNKTTIKNNMVSEIYNKTMLVFDMVSEMKEKIVKSNIQTIAENDMVLLKDMLTMFKNDTLLLKDVQTMSKTDMVLDQECETIAKNDTVLDANYVELKTTIKNDMVLDKMAKTTIKNDNSIDNINIYNNINSKNNIKEDKEYILDNYKNASERSIFHKGEKRSEEEKLVPSPSSSNQKFIDSLIQDMKEEFPDGDRAKRTEVLSFFSELKEDYLSHDPELSQLSLEEIFPHFKSAGVRIYTYYSEHIEKSDEELRLEFMSLPVSEDFDESLLGLSDQEKVEMIKSDFREAFPEDEMVELDAMTDYVVGYMRDLELMKVDQVLYDSPLLLSHMFPELQRDKESKLWHRRPNKAEIREIDENGGRMIVIKPKFKERAEKARIDSNPFYEKLKRFRFPRLTITSSGSCNASEVIPKVLAELGYENGFYEDQEVIDQILDVIIDRYKLQGRSFEPFRNIWVYCDKYHHKQPGKVLITNLPEIKKMKA